MMRKTGADDLLPSVYSKSFPDGPEPRPRIRPHHPNETSYSTPGRTVSAVSCLLHGRAH
jgi:hypothetical protein